MARLLPRMLALAAAGVLAERSQRGATARVQVRPSAEIHARPEEPRARPSGWMPALPEEHLRHVRSGFAKRRTDGGAVGGSLLEAFDVPGGSGGRRPEEASRGASAELPPSEFIVERTQDGEYDLWVRGPHFSEGSFGKVYSGVMAKGGVSEEVAVKVACQTYPEPWAAFMRRVSAQEYRMKLPALESDYIIRLERAFTSSVSPHCRLLVMQLAELDYFDALDRHDIRGPHQYIQHERILNDILLALVRTHRAGYVHRDVKPENILLKWDKGKRRYRGMLADLDFLCAEGDPDCNGVVGSPMYFPPEFWLSGGTLMASSQQDVFAAGLTFLGVLGGGRWERRLAEFGYEGVLAQQHPTEMQRVGDVLVEMARDTMSALEALSQHLPIASVLMRMIEPDPQRRCSAEECLFELSAVERHHGPASGTWWHSGIRRAAEEVVPWRLGMLWPLPYYA